MAVHIASSAVRTCFGDGAATFAALLFGACGAGPLRRADPAAVGVSRGHYAPGSPAELIAACVAEAVGAADVTPGSRVVAITGTGLGELAAVEAAVLGGPTVPVERLHFADAVRAAAAGVSEVVSLTGACSAGGYALALAQDFLELGEADAVVVAAADTATTSMLAMIGLVGPEPTDRVRPFDRDRAGVLLGDGAAAVVLIPDGPAVGRLLATGLSCDANHPTAPDVDGIGRAVDDAFVRARRRPADVGLVVAHGTGTALNDPAECAALVREFGSDAGPLVTAVKGAVGHTSGVAALVNLEVALRCLAGGLVPAVTGLRVPLDEAAGVRLVRSTTVAPRPLLIQSNAFGFGGVNAVTLLEAA